jgi:hypothetical protein
MPSFFVPLLGSCAIMLSVGLVSCELLSIGMHVSNGGKPTSTLGVEEWSLSIRIKISAYNIPKGKFFLHLRGP